MQNTFWLIDGQLAGRPGPAMEPWSLEDLRRSGFEAVLNLSEYPSAEDELAAAGVESLWIPLPTAVPPDLDAENLCLELVPRAHDFLTHHIGEGRQVLVHCLAGCDRTGLVLAYYLAKTYGLEVGEAIDRIRQARPPALSAAGWEEMAVRVISRLLAA